MALDISTLIRITTRISAGGVPRTAFGTGLLVSVDRSISAGGTGKARIFSSVAEVQEVYDAGAVVDAATVWFSADPLPQSLYVGNWANVDVSTTLRGGEPDTVAAIALTNASFAVNGSDVTVDLSAATTYAAVATALQTAILAVGAPFTGATMVYDTDAFLLTLTGADDIGYFGPHSAGTGVDISGLLGMTLAAGASYRVGHDQESVTDGVTEMVALATGGAPVALMLTDDAPLLAGGVDTRDALAAFAEAGDYMFGLRDSAAQAVAPNDATSHGARAFAASQGQTLACYTKPGELPDIGALAALSAQNLNNPASIITLHPKPLPGVEFTSVTLPQLNELSRKRMNVLTSVGGQPAFLEGYTSRGGYWSDAVWALMWLKNEMELNIFNAMRASRRLTSGILRDTVLQVMDVALRAGVIQPGRRFNAATRQDVITSTGNQMFSGVATNGYILWIDSNPTDLDREARIGRFKIWMTGSEAIHKVYGDLVFVN